MLTFTAEFEINDTDLEARIERIANQYGWSKEKCAAGMMEAGAFHELAKKVERLEQVTEIKNKMATGYNTRG